ncbi:MAG: UDP-N-acetylmuramoyl-L-alanyl-D-glutamate--2,6-diaminopimelate ligase, partial [Sphingomonas sp.]|nr:UDP-N-acetylmuramoyl-L-alanyl-D-glutamate--2,6-diaminopimelate ligase [Sphingomonas sp.]
MRLTDLLPDIPAEAGQARITGVAIDPRKVAPGTVFGAFKGARFNGEDFIGQAIAHGAVAVISAP